MPLLTLILLFSHAPAFAEGKTITKAKFTSEIGVSLPKLFCAKEAYFRKCFQVSEEECASAAKGAVADCAKEADKQLPAQLQQPADGQKWGQAIGQCAGARFEKRFIAKKADTADCKDPAKWK